jgi:hypothetical protein
MVETPSYVIYRVEEPLTIDGVLDEPAWQAAPTIALREAQQGGEPRQPTVARLLWDDAHLYVSWVCEDRDIWGTMTRRGDPIYDEEVVELFLDADRDGIGYVEIEVSPRNTVLDLFMLNRDDRWKQLWSWQSKGLKTAVVVEGDPTRRGTDDVRWTVEMALPLVDLMTAPHVPPLPGDVWLGNLYRIDRADDGDEFSAWSPVYRDTFHTPARFGQLCFSGESI